MRFDTRADGSKSHADSRITSHSGFLQVWYTANIRLLIHAGSLGFSFEVWVNISGVFLLLLLLLTEADRVRVYCFTQLIHDDVA